MKEKRKGVVTGERNGKRRRANRRRCLGFR